MNLPPSQHIDDQTANAALNQRESVMFIVRYDPATKTASVSTAPGGKTITLPVSFRVHFDPSIIVPNTRVVVTKVSNHPPIITDIIALPITQAAASIDSRDLTQTGHTSTIIHVANFAPNELLSLQIAVVGQFSTDITDIFSITTDSNGASQFNFDIAGLVPVNRKFQTNERLFRLNITGSQSRLTAFVQFIALFTEGSIK